TSGAAQAVALSVSGLPARATASFSATSCTPTCSRQLTISTTPAISPGTYQITVTGSPLGRRTTFALVVTQKTASFADVAADDAFSTWIDALWAAGITGGCAADPARYCPDAGVTRAQMAVFLLRAIAYPDPASPAPPSGAVFADVAATDPFGAWIEDLFAAGITGGCGTGPLRYCPADFVTRGQMAVFLVRTFGLPL
ncbi:MAG: hypothetical protein ACREF4_19910, partial [Gammaproteobacteria bacterium]